MTPFRRFKARRIASPLLVLLMGCSTLGSAHAGWFDGDSDDKPAATKAAGDQKPDAAKPGVDLEQTISQAKLLRLAGHYEEAVHSLSQIMLVASDDPRVIAEYGKTLAAMGRASDAVQFLTRATQLSPADWTVYSALGVAYDQLGKQPEAQSAYERALSIRSNEPGVLNNYALSRMLAHDPEMAHKLIARAQAAGGAADPKIARNIAMIDDLAPVLAADARPAQPAKPAAFTPAPQMAANAPTGAPRPLIQSAPLAPATTAAPTASAAPARSGSVVMQQVPVDPLAGPVAPHKAVARAETRPQNKPAGKPVTKVADAAPEKPVAKKDAVPSLRLSANAY